MKAFDVKIIDARPEVGVFEIVDDIFLKDAEASQPLRIAGSIFSGEKTHLHARDIKTHVLSHPDISDATKAEFAANPDAYLNWPRGRVDYDIDNGKWCIMAARKFITQENIERVTREFHLPPYASGKISLIADDGHYGY